MLNAARRRLSHQLVGDSSFACRATRSGRWLHLLRHRHNTRASRVARGFHEHFRLFKLEILLGETVRSARVDRTNDLDVLLRRSWLLIRRHAVRLLDGRKVVAALTHLVVSWCVSLQFDQARALTRLRTLANQTMRFTRCRRIQLLGLSRLLICTLK